MKKTYRLEILQGNGGMTAVYLDDHRIGGYRDLGLMYKTHTYRIDKETLRKTLEELDNETSSAR